MTFSQGGLSASLGNLLSVDSGGRCVVGEALAPSAGAPNLRIAFTRGTGEVSGSFTHPGNQRMTEFCGVFL